MQRRSMSLGLAAITLAAVFGGVPAQAQPTPEQIINGFEGVLGPVRTYRPSHPKGICAAGHFTATPEGTRLSVAPVFNGQRVNTIIRFGVAGANPQADDRARSTRGLGIRFETAAGDVWDMANISAPIFGAPDPAVFLANLQVRAPDPATGRPNAERIAAFVAANPSVALQGRYLAATPPPASWATTPYWGVNAFRFQGQDGQARHARWVFEPRAGIARLSEEQTQSLPRDFLADEIRGRIARGPVEFDMVLQFPSPGDDLVNPTVAWPEDRPRAVVGRLTVTSVAAGAGGPCDAMSFLTLDQEPGISFSDDPTLHARTGSYAVSLSRRTN